MNGYFFISALAISVTLSAVFSTISLKKGVAGKSLVINASLISLIFIPIVGLGTGTFYSHGFDIPWWIFGTFISLVIILMSCITLVFYKLITKNEKT